MVAGGSRLLHVPHLCAVLCGGSCASHAGRVGGRWGADGRAGQAGGAGGEKALTPFPSLAAG